MKLDKNLADEIKELKTKSIRETLYELTPQKQKENINISDIKSIIKNEINKSLPKENNKILTSMWKLHNQMLGMKNDFELNMKKKAEDIFNSDLFWDNFSKKTMGWLDEQIDIKIRNEDYHKLVSDSIKLKLKDNLSPIIRTIVLEFISSIDKKLCNEYNKVRELSYCIDSELKHIIQKSPITQERSQMVYNRINRILDKEKSYLEKKDLLLEDENGKKMEM